MPETTRRVVVTLVAATDEPAHQVMAGVLDAVRNRLPDPPTPHRAAHRAVHHP